MNEEIDSAMQKVIRSAEEWEDSKTRSSAMQLCFQLSVMKLLVGIDKFDELPYFSRLLAEVTAWLNEDDKDDIRLQKKCRNELR